MSAPPDHWNQHAVQWNWIGSPLRPAPDDVAAAQRALLAWAASGAKRPPDALLLGVTPELAHMPLPSGASLLALDHSRAMIRGVWRAPHPRASAVCANWSAMPLPRASQDVIFGDGCFSALMFPLEYRDMARELRRVARDDAVLLMRFFTRPETPEKAAAVVDHPIGGRIGNFHAFKWRLAMALHGTLEQGVRLADIWDAWHDAVPDPDALAAGLGWAPQSVRTMDAYRGVQTRYTFPTLAESRAALNDGFAEIECLFPGYELGERCPSLICRAR